MTEEQRQQEADSPCNILLYYFSHLWSCRFSIIVQQINICYIFVYNAYINV